MANKGYGLLHRKFFDHELWQEPRVFSKAEAWIDIVFCVARGTNTREVKRGQFRASLTWLASRWGWDKAKVARFVGWLIDKEMIQKVHADGKDVRIYLVVNYEKLQNPQYVADENSRHYADTPSDTPSDTGTDTPTDTLKPASVVVFPQTTDTPSDTGRDTPSDTPSDTNRNTGLNTGEKKTPRREPDFAYEAFKAKYAERYKLPYAPNGKQNTVDFVQANTMRKDYSIPARASPEDWDVVLMHYFATPQDSHTFADVCSRYSIFRLHALDRFKQPVRGDNGRTTDNPDRRAAQDFVSRKLAETVRSGVPDVREDPRRLS